MRILVLSKRQYSGKDLLDDSYGRLYEIPSELAARGHEVFGLALSYRYRASGFTQNVDLNNPCWHSVNVLPVGLWRYPRQLARLVKEFRPDVIWACSDAFHVIIGWAVSASTGIPLVVDLYDNFESFAGTRIPGVKQLFRAACRHASALTVVSHELQQYVITTCGIKAPIFVTGNGIRKNMFFARDRQEARKALNLPIKGQLIGTAGAITANRGISDLFEAFLLLSAENPDLYLVIAGPRDRTIKGYHHPRTIDLGVLPFERVPELFSALDVAIVCNRDSNFGRYCYPLKLFEIIASGTPIVAAQVGDVGRLLAETPDNLYQPGLSGELAQRILGHLRAPKPAFGLSVPTWSSCCDVVEKAISAATGINKTVMSGIQNSDSVDVG